MGVDYLTHGPTHVYVQHYYQNVLSNVLPLGITTGGVRRRTEQLWRPAPSDGAGETQVEATYHGVSFVVSMSISVHDVDILERVKLPLPNFSLVPGYIPPGAIGTFFRKQKNYFRLLLWLPLAAAQGVSEFINLPMARLGSVDEASGIEEKRIQMTWIGHTPMAYCQGGSGSYYNIDGTGWPGAISCPT